MAVTIHEMQLYVNNKFGRFWLREQFVINFAERKKISVLATDEHELIRKKQLDTDLHGKGGLKKS